MGPIPMHSCKITRIHAQLLNFNTFLFFGYHMHTSFSAQNNLATELASQECNGRSQIFIFYNKKATSHTKKHNLFAI